MAGFVTDTSVWLDLNWAAVLHTVDQIVLAGGGPGAAWPACAWYVHWHGAHRYQITRVLRSAWFDVTGEVLP